MMPPSLFDLYREDTRPMPTESNFAMNTSVENGKAVVKISGDADFTRVGIVDDEIKKVLKQQPKEVVFDLAGLRLIASMGIGALVELSSSVRKRGGKVKTINAGPAIVELLTMVRLEEILGLEPKPAPRTAE